jgi:transcription elongation factor GreA
MNNTNANKTMLSDDELKKYAEELEHLKTVSRPENIEKIKAARALGDLSENEAYDEAKDEQAKIEARIMELDSIIKNNKNTDENQ